MSFDLQRSNSYPELNRLICRAISNPKFANKLIVAPEAVLTSGEHKLSPSEEALVRSIRARDIYDFAAQLYLMVSRGEE